MKTKKENDLTPFEKDLLKSINVINGKSFTHKNFMEWSTSKETISKNLQSGEVIYETLGCFVAIKTNL